jgi:hypothetical protein
LKFWSPKLKLWIPVVPKAEAEAFEESPDFILGQKLLSFKVLFSEKN